MRRPRRINFREEFGDTGQDRSFGSGDVARQDPGVSLGNGPKRRFEVSRRYVHVRQRVSDDCAIGTAGDGDARETASYGRHFGNCGVERSPASARGCNQRAINVEKDHGQHGHDRNGCRGGNEEPLTAVNLHHFPLRGSEIGWIAGVVCELWSAGWQRWDCAWQ